MSYILCKYWKLDRHISFSPPESGISSYYTFWCLAIVMEMTVLYLPFNHLPKEATLVCFAHHLSSDFGSQLLFIQHRGHGHLNSGHIVLSWSQKSEIQFISIKIHLSCCKQPESITTLMACSSSSLWCGNAFVWGLLCVKYWALCSHTVAAYPASTLLPFLSKFNSLL